MDKTGMKRSLFRRHETTPAGKGVLALYWRVVVKPYFWQAMTICFLMLASAVLEMLTVGLAVPLLDIVTNPNRAGSGRTVDLVQGGLSLVGLPAGMNTVIFGLLVFASLLFLGRSGFLFLQQYLTAVVAQKMRKQMKFLLFERFLYAQYESLLERGRGAILYDMNKPPDLVYGGIVQLGLLLTAVMNGALLGGLMFYLSWWATLLIALLAIVGVQGMRRFLDRRAAGYGRMVYELSRDREKVEVDSIDGLKIVKAQGLEGCMIRQQQTLLEAEMRPNLRLVLFSFGPSFVNEAAACIVVLGLAAVTFLAPAVGMDFPTMVAFLVAIRRTGPALANVNSTLVDLNRSRRGIEVLEEVLHLVPAEPQGGAQVSRVEEIEFEGVAFYYAARPEHQVLQNISLTMKRGMVTAIVGPTGAGKSTIANLLIGLYRPSSGKILVNGNNLNDLSLRDWRRGIGYVSQDVFLFNATVRENIALWDESVSRDEIEVAARMAQLHEFIMTLPNGYDTVVGDRGLKLSGGQCQRVAVARAILRKPELLILDEATSALDTLTESAVYEAIHALREDSIVIVIAHRLTTIRDADQIAVLCSGKLMELGRHESLINLGGVYAGLYEQDGNGRPERQAELSATDKSL